MMGDVLAHRKWGAFSRVPKREEHSPGTEAYLCCCSTSSSRLLPSRLLAVQPCRPELGAGVWKVLMPPRGARIED